MDGVPSGNHPWTAFPNIIEVRAGAPSAADRSSVARILFQLETIRRFEQWLVDYEDLVHGPVHSSIGQEAVAVGAAAALDRQDFITSTHRAHHHVVAKVMEFHTPSDFDPAGESATPAAVTDAVYRTMAEIMGLAAGWAGGRGGSEHLSDPESGVLATTAIVGGSIPIAAGAALAAKERGSGAVALAFFGDGATSIGAFHEGISMAKVWSLPAIFLVDNNMYSVATTVMETVGFEDIVIRAAGQNIPGLIVDGMDPFAVRNAVRLAREHAAGGLGPVLIEAKTYRFLHQSGGRRGSEFQYRTKEEEEEWRARDPLTTFPRMMMETGVMTSAEIETVRQRAAALIDEVTGRCTARAGETWLIPEALRPDTTQALRGVVSDGHEFEGVAATEPDKLPLGDEVSFIDAIALVIRRAMERDPEVLLLGEDVGHLRGGVYGGSRHALRDFPERLLNTPIAENGFAGVALGAAMVGMKPIVELMFPDFALEAADQLFNHIGKARYMYGGELALRLIVRTRTAQGRGYGPQHSSDPAALFGLFPGWRIVAPSTPADYVGLFNAALLSEDPVLIIEHHRLWPMKGRLPIGDLDYIIPFGNARVVRAGTDVTVLTWSHPTHRVLAIAEQLADEGISVEVLDLRSIDRNSLDVAAIEASVSKTGAVVIVEDATRSHSMGVQIADHLYPALFRRLRHPITRVAGRDVPTPVSKVLEEFVLLRDTDILEAIRSVALRTARVGVPASS